MLQYFCVLGQILYGTFIPYLKVMISKKCNAYDLFNIKCSQ